MSLNQKGRKGVPVSAGPVGSDCQGQMGLLHSGSVGKESACNAGNEGSMPGSGRSPGGGHSNPLQYPCLENPVDRGALWATVHSVSRNQAQAEVTGHTHTHWGQEDKSGIQHPILPCPVFKSLGNCTKPIQTRLLGGLVFSV